MTQTTSPDPRHAPRKSGVAHPAVRASLGAAAPRPADAAAPARPPVPAEGADVRKDAALWRAALP